MVQVDPSANFTDLRPARSDPPLYHFLGFGLYLYGDRDFDVETQSFVRTLCFCLLYIPVFALRSYRVAPTDDGWRCLGVEPVSGPARLSSLVAAVALLGGGGFFGVSAYRNSPGQVALRRLAEADRLEAEGHFGDAAALLADVSVESTEHAGPGAKRLAKLLESASAQTDRKDLGAVFQAAVRVQKAGRWPAETQTLYKGGVDLAKDTAAKDPRAAWTILDSIASLVPEEPSVVELRHDLLEKVVAADPSDPEWASRLAVDYESKNQLDRCEKILEPLRARLGETEGARVLGLIDARANRIDKALPMLRAYTKGRLQRLGSAEVKLRTLAQSGQERILGQLKKQRASDFDYSGFRDADNDSREKMLIAYIEGKMKGDVQFAQAQQALIAESAVTPAALELGLILLQQAQAQSDPQTRKSLLDEAEATFLAVSRIAGEREDFQLSLAQVYYWQGKQAEGRRLLDETLNAHNREAALLLQVAGVLRNVGSLSEARVLAEEGYNKATPGQVKSGCAVIRGVLGEDVEDRILWLNRGDTNDPHVKAILTADLAAQALEQGNEDLAITHLRSVVSLYDSMPESGGVLNNEWIALTQLATLTGDVSARQRAVAMIEKAAALNPGNSLTLSNASESLLEEGLRDVIGPAIELSVVKQRPTVDILDFLATDQRTHEAFADRLRTHRGVNRALSMMEKLLLLAPRNPSSYRAPFQVLVFRREIEGLSKLLASLARTELDLEGQRKQARETYSGKNDDMMKIKAKGALGRVEPILPVARAKGGPTFALAAAHVVRARMFAAIFGAAVDRDAMVGLAEEAFASSPSLASRWNLMDAVLFRATDRLAKADQRFAAVRDRSLRSTSTLELISGVLSQGGPLQALTLEDADVNRAVDLLHDAYVAAPSNTSGPRSWILFRSRYPDVASAVAKSYAKDEIELLKDQIDAWLTPYAPTSTLVAYWRARMENRENEALKIVEDARSRGIPIPID